MRFDDDDLVGDVLASMTEVLLDNYRAGVKHVDSPSSSLSKAVVPRTESREKGYRRPPGDIFYRQSVTFMTKPSFSIPVKRCTCRFVCNGSTASVKCFSCIIYDKEGLGYYCKACFSQKHPPYRVDHIFTDITNDENIPYILSISQQLANAVRYEKEGDDLYKSVQLQSQRLEKLKESTVERKMKDVGRRTLELEERLKRLQLQNQSSSKEPPLRLTEAKEAHKSRGYTDEVDIRGHLVTTAVTLIQACYRGYRSRYAVSLVYATRIFRAIDKLTNREFYYDKVRDASSWYPPKLLLQRHVPLTGVMPGTATESATTQQLWFLKNRCQRRRPALVHSKVIAKEIIRCFLACVEARKVAVALACALYNRVWDEDYQAYYYCDLRLPQDSYGATSWERPRVFLNSQQPPVFET